MHVKDQLT